MPHWFFMRFRLPTVASGVAVCLLISSFAPYAHSQASHAEIKKEIFEDGVEHWYVVGPPNRSSYLWQKLQQICDVVFSKKTLPFGKSIAFLVGVGRYHHLPDQLDTSVPNDLVEMRNLLLNEMAFDEVYIAKDDVVSRDRVEEYVKGKIGSPTIKNDRLLFYYSGHGGDNHGKTGYMQFGGAEKDKFYGPQVLAVDTLMDWSRELKFKHMLFILDSCASGLAFTSKGVPSDKLMQTLSGNGSRAVITAATADEATYALDSRKHLGNGIFTAALLKAFRSPDLSKTPLVTTAELYARVQIEMANFRASTGAKTTPQIWPLDEGDYSGTFVFLNARAEKSRLTSDEAEALGATATAKGDDELSITQNAGTGIIETFSTQDGIIFIDSLNMGDIRRGETLRFQRQAQGSHQVQLRSSTETSPAALQESKTIMVESGKIALAIFGSSSPVDKSGKLAVGTLVIDATHESGGEVSIDNVSFGQLSRDGHMSIANLMAGPHKVQVSQGDKIIIYPIEINANQTEYFVQSPNVVNPPSGLIASVQ